MTTGGVHNEPNTRITQYRLGEILALFERGDGTDDVNDYEFYQAVHDTFGKDAKVRLYDPPPSTEISYGLSSHPASFRTLRSGNGKHKVGHLPLAEWRPNLGREDDLVGDQEELDNATAAVPRACEDLNTYVQGAPNSVRGWRLAATTPNWGVKALPVDGTGGPGGRPVKAEAARMFCSEDVRQEVIDHIGADRIKRELLDGRDVRVVILDTWPMDDEKGLAIGGQPTEPLALIKRFYHKPENADAQSNPHLKQAVDGTLVDIFRDYVSGQPTTSPPVRHYNVTNHSFEPYYDIPDHGLFIAGMIRDIAPKAEIAVYRILNKHGSTDLATFMQAVDDAIADAKDVGKKLIINLSLAFAPPLRTVAELFREPVAKQTVHEWSALVESVGMDRSEAEVRQLADVVGFVDVNMGVYNPEELEALEEQGLVEIVEEGGRRVKRLLDPIRLIDHLLDPTDPEVFVVASAGNNSSPTKVYGPRLPALIEGVLGVSAWGAAYSNLDDITKLRDDGVSAFGGMAETRQLQPTSDTMPGAGMVGAAVSDIMPPPTREHPFGVTPDGAPTNNSGWIEWAGTSFAAPIASALAAVIWSDQISDGTNYSSQDLMKDIVGREQHLEIRLQQRCLRDMVSSAAH